MTPDRTPTSTDVVIGEAAIAAVGALTTGQLLSAVTPERIGELTGYSASSIRYRLNGTSVRTANGSPETNGGRGRGWSFDRERLLACAVDAYRVHAHAARERARDRYLAALTELGQGDPIPLERALDAEIRDLAEGDAERLYLIALAGGPQSPEIGDLLRQVEADRRDANRSLVHHGLSMLGRQPSAGVTADGVAEAVNHYLRGVAFRRGFEPQAGDGILLRAVMGLIFALTHATADGASERIDAILAGLAHAS